MFAFRDVEPGFLPNIPPQLFETLPMLAMALGLYGFMMSSDFAFGFLPDE